jgi:hypothetical protein
MNAWLIFVENATEIVSEEKKYWNNNIFNTNNQHVMWISNENANWE